MNMRRVQIYLPQKLKSIIKELACRNRKTASAMHRELLDAGLKAKENKEAISV
jgi:Ribbon-helix-helix protein, copG family